MLMTDSEAIAKSCAGFSTESGQRGVVFDPRPAANGSIRIAKAIEKYFLPVMRGKETLIVNWQADEVLLHPDDVRAAVLHHATHNPSGVTTIVGPLSNGDIANTNAVKACYHNNHVVWFARGKHAPPGWMKHVGLYVYGLDVLKRIGGMIVHPAAIEASLEQLTWLCAGIPIHAVRAEHPTFSVNDEKDLEKFREMLKGSIQ